MKTPCKLPLVSKLTKNDQSFVVKVFCDEFTMLLPGDATTETWKSFTNKRVFKSTLLVAPHHGSNAENEASIYDFIEPEYIMISSGKRSKYGHPTHSAAEEMCLSLSKINLDKALLTSNY